MNKIKFISLTASLVLAMSFTFSCSVDEIRDYVNGSSSSNGGEAGNLFGYCLVNGQCLSGPFTSKECGDLGGLPSNSNSCTGGGGGNPSSSSGGGQGGGGGGSYNLGATGPGGGIIFYYSEVGFMMTDNNQVCHYLEAAATDMVGLAWATSDFQWRTLIEGTASSIGSGRKNTALILATDANAPAAKACKDLTTGGKTDWFLPSFQEMQELWKKRSSADGGFVTLMGPKYLSSTEFTTQGSNVTIVSNVYVDYVSKGNLDMYIRCIRAF
jgi:hypothetical protein